MTRFTNRSIWQSISDFFYESYDDTTSTAIDPGKETFSDDVEKLSKHIAGFQVLAEEMKKYDVLFQSVIDAEANLTEQVKLLRKETEASKNQVPVSKPAALQINLETGKL